MIQRNHLLPVAVGGFFFALDQALKYIAHGDQRFRAYLIDPWLGWEFFANPGIAFSVPFPNPVLIIGTPILLVLLLVYIGRKRPLSPRHMYGASLIFFGGISNLIDRILFGITIDYLRIITAVINIADVMIVMGTVLLILQANPTKRDLDKKAVS